MANVPIKPPEAKKPAIAAFNPKQKHSTAPSKEQPKVLAKFSKEVVLAGKVLAANTVHEVPLDFAHSLSAHIIK